jgi:aspartyl-tRNA(Asn)/glutamyl-tRNA(Gln) amidotransferase subunit A
VKEITEAVYSGARAVSDHAHEAIRRIEAASELNAFISVRPESIAAQVQTLSERLAERPRAHASLPLAGVPIAVKDNIVTSTIRTTCGSRLLENWTPPYDATAVVKLQEAGAVIIGKTNLDEFGMGSSTEFSFAGPTRNPHDLDRVPGGSSGGSAAAVAAGLVPAALGSDTGGSVRQPASYCGVVGVKPTYGRVSRYGLVPYASSLEQIGTLTRSVEDAARILQVIAGKDPCDSTSIDIPVPDLIAASRRPAEGLRVGIVQEMLGAGTQAEVARATKQAAEALRAAGALVEHISIPSTTHALAAYYLIAPAEASSNLGKYDGVRFGLRVDGRTSDEMTTRTRTAGFGPEAKRRIMLGTYALSSGYYDAYYLQAQKVRTVVREEFDRALQAADILIGPTAPTTAFRIGELVDDLHELILMDVCTVMANLAGLPAASIPWGTDDAGLPIGVQLIARHFREDTLLQVSAALERAAPPLPAPTLAAAERRTGD